MKLPEFRTTARNRRTPLAPGTDEQAMVLRDIAHYRLANQQIAQPKRTKPHEVVASLGAMQAQDYLGALWGIGVRLPDATEADIERAIADRTIIRTWPMRGTLHFVAARDVRWMLELLAQRTIASGARRHRQLELDDALFARSKKLFISALQGGGQLTRKELSELLERANISTAGQRGYHILWRLAHDGVICFGTRRRKQPTFVLLDEWLPDARSMTHDEALAELTRRYFTGHGPATFPDFVQWSGLKSSDAQKGLEMVSSQLAHVTFDGKIYWMPQGVPPSRPMSPTAYLLPGFDEWMLGYKDRSASLDPQYASQIIPGDNGMFSPTIVVGGRVVGTWKRTLEKNAVVITLSPFTSLNKTQARAVAAAAERYGKFLGLNAQLADSR